MLNTNILNENEVNYTSGVNTETGEVSYSSFSDIQITKYALKTKLGQYFNFGNFGKFDNGLCIGENRIQYGNILLETDVEDLGEKELQEFSNPIRDGGFFGNIRTAKQEFSFTIKVMTDTFGNLEKEIADIKRNFNLGEAKITRQEVNKFSEIDVEITDVEVGNLDINGTEITISFISLDPFFKKPMGGGITYYGLVGDKEVNFIINDTGIKPLVNHIINITSITGTITKIELEVNGYNVNFETNITSPGLVEIDYKKSKVFIGGVEIEDFNGKMIEYNIFEQNNIKVKFTGGVPTYDLYFNYDNLYR